MPIRPTLAARRLAVLRLALRLTAGAFASTAFSIGHQPFGDSVEAMEWLRQQLAPLACKDQLIRDMMLVIDPERSTRPWDSPRGTKRELLRLAARVQARAGVTRKVPGRERNTKVFPGR